MKPKPNDVGASRRQILAEHEQIAALAERIATTSSAGLMVAHLTELLPLLQRHFQAEEDLDGLHASIRKRTPHHEHALQELQQDHKSLIERTRLLLTLAQETSGGEKLRALGEQLRDRLREHEARETETFLDSIWTDLGGSD